MAKQDIDIKIGAQFVGGKAFDNARKQIGGIEGAAASLAKKLLGAFSVYKILEFGKKSVEAFAKDEAAAKALEIQLKNTGNAFATADVEYFIQKTQKLTGVLDDDLRPAFQSILTSSGSVIDAQKALGVALDVAAATGNSVVEVSQALAKGYTGQTTAIQRLGVGIDKATLASGDMNKILDALSTKFAGQAQERVKTFAGQLDLLKVSANNASEIIGKDLVDSMSMLAGSEGDIRALTAAIEEFATKIGDAIYGVSSLISEFKKLPGVGQSLDFLLNNKIIGPFALLNQLSDIGKQQKQKDLAKRTSTFTYSLGAGATGEIAAQKQKQIEKDRLKLLKDQNKAIKDQASIKKGNALFDMQQIQIMAALQGKLTDEEKLRLALQLAIIQGNVTEVDRLSAELAKSQLLTTGLATAIANLPPALNPFKEFPNYINDILRQILMLQDALNKLKMPDLVASTAGALTASAQAMGFASNEAYQSFRAGERSSYSPNVAIGMNAAGTTIVNVTVDGSVISQGDLTDAIRSSLLDQSASGSFSTIGSNGRVRDY